MRLFFNHRGKFGAKWRAIVLTRYEIRRFYLKFEALPLHAGAMPRLLTLDLVSRGSELLTNQE